MTPIPTTPIDHENLVKNIDIGLAAILGFLAFISIFSPKLKAAMPFIRMFLTYQAHKLQGGLADGTLVPDGRGGIVPITNSRYDPKTGRFL